MQKGESADSIAAAMSDVLNEAQKEYIHKKDEAAAKREAMRDVLSAICHYCVITGHDNIAKDITDLALKDETLDEYIRQIDKVMEFADALEELEFPIEEEIEGVCGSPSCKCGNESCECMNPEHKAFVIPKDVATMINKAFNSFYGIGHDK